METKPQLLQMQQRFSWPCSTSNTNFKTIPTYSTSTSNHPILPPPPPPIETVDSRLLTLEGEPLPKHYVRRHKKETTSFSDRIKSWAQVAVACSITATIVFYVLYTIIRLVASPNIDESNHKSETQKIALVIQSLEKIQSVIAAAGIGGGAPGSHPTIDLPAIKNGTTGEKPLPQS